MSVAGDEGGATRQRRHIGLAVLAGMVAIAVLFVQFGGGSGQSAGGGGNWILLPATSEPQPRAAAVPIAADVQPGRRFAQGLVVVQRIAGAADAGFVISAGSEAALLAQHQLRVGDVLLTMDGRPLDAARIAALPDELAEFDRLEISFERSGQMRNRQLTFK